MSTEHATENMSTEHATENMMCPIICERKKYSLALLAPKCRTKAQRPTFIVPISTFLKSGAVWTALQLCTIFWEPPIYGIERSWKENEDIKRSYLLAFASYDAPLCKAWAYDCLMNNRAEEYGAYFELTVYNSELVNNLKQAFQKHEFAIEEEGLIMTIV